MMQIESKNNDFCRDHKAYKTKAITIPRGFCETVGGCFVNRESMGNRKKQAQYFNNEVDTRFLHKK